MAHTRFWPVGRHHWQMATAQRRLRSTLPMFPKAFVPKLEQLYHLEKERRMRQTECFNERHKSRDLNKLLPGHLVWITDAEAQGRVTSVHLTSWSYVISEQKGTIRRNSRHLVHISIPEPTKSV